MPPKGCRKPPQTEGQAQSAGLSLLTSFFKKPAGPREAELPAKKRGRPSKEETRGRKGEATFLPTQESAVLPVDHPEPVETRLVTTRVNWSQGEDAKRLQAAVADWDHKSGERPRNDDRLHDPGSGEYMQVLSTKLSLYRILR